MLRFATCMVLGLAIGGIGAAAAQERGAPGGHAALSTEAREAAEPVLEAPDAEADAERVFGEPVGFYDPSGRALAPLHRALRRVDESGDEQARLVFYGASHVAADFFTNVLRERLQQRFGDAGPGFVMPARPWRTYRLLNGVHVESSARGWDAHRVRASTREIDALGVAGLAVEADSAAAHGRVDTGARTASRFVVFYLKQPDGGGFEVRLDGRRVARVATGSDRVEAGVEVITAREARHVLEVRPRGDGPVRLFGVSIEREAAGVIVDNMGINGARAVSHLYWDEELHQAYLRRLEPDLVVLAYGTNESGDDDHPIERYEAQLRRVVARVRGTVPGAACMLIGPSDRPLRGDDGVMVDRPRTAQVIEVQRRVSRDMGCAFFDLVAFSGGPLSMVRWSESDPSYAQRDLVHYSVRGYLRLGEVLHDAMLDGFDAVPRFDPPRAVVPGPRP